LNMKYIISESQYKKLISEDGKYIYIDRQVNSFIYEDGHKVTLYQATSDQVKDIVPKYRRRVRVLRKYCLFSVFRTRFVLYAFDFMRSIILLNA
jgi:hypothetical protein